jgi:hypothetical protein
MAGMLAHHLGNLIAACWWRVLAWNSATPYSLFKDLGIPLLTFAAAWGVQFGKDWRNWAVIKAQGKKILIAGAFTVGIPVIILIAAFLFAIPDLIYEDHQQLIGELAKLRYANSKLVDPTTRDAQITDLKVQIAELKKIKPRAVTVALVAAAPVQTTLTEPTFGTVTIASQENVASEDVAFKYKLKVVIQTTKSVEPVDLILRCTGEIGKLAGGPSISLMDYTQIQPDDHTRVLLAFQSPAFTPERAIVLYLYSLSMSRVLSLEQGPSLF